MLTATVARQCFSLSSYLFEQATCSNTTLSVPARLEALAIDHRYQSLVFRSGTYLNLNPPTRIFTHDFSGR
jgi:hypothetical protein